MCLCASTMSVGTNKPLQLVSNLRDLVFLLVTAFCMVRSTADSAQAAARSHLSIWESVIAVWKCCECDRSQCADSITRTPPVASLSQACRTSNWQTDWMLFKPCMWILCVQIVYTGRWLTFHTLHEKAGKKKLLKWQLVIRFHFLTLIWF